MIDGFMLNDVLFDVYEVPSSNRLVPVSFREFKRPPVEPMGASYSEMSRHDG